MFTKVKNTFKNNRTIFLLAKQAYCVHHLVWKLKAINTVKAESHVFNTNTEPNEPENH